AQYRARLLAFSNVDRPCSKSYNAVALPDPQSNAWIVWALAATGDPETIVIGGHYRFTISRDGSTLLGKDALSKGCLVLPKGKPASDEKGAGMILQHIVSLTPLETYVFASFSYGEPMIVGTLDGKAWRIDRDVVGEVNMDTPGWIGSAARHLAGLSENCKAMLKDGDDVKNVDVKVIDNTEDKKKFEVPVPAGYTLSAVECVRNDIVPAPNDYRVLNFAGVPLYIADKGAGHDYRLGAITRKNGNCEFTVIDGAPLTSDLNARIRARLDEFNHAY
ncbi:MAG: hypothetical protein JO208_15640, partial [Alphaproteobacteria bacterium]|nr:hypothetical protein [Alphaproteobacteria bacterium]